LNEAFVEGLALDELHDHDGGVFVVAVVEQTDGVRVFELAGEGHLAVKTFDLGFVVGE
jgi:hypothetical protein